MDMNRYMSLGHINPSDMVNFSRDIDKDLAAIFNAKDQFFKKYLEQSHYKKGDVVMLKHRKRGWMRAKIHKIGVNSLTGGYSYIFKSGGKLIPDGHITEFHML